jgi:hypothetical protein
MSLSKKRKTAIRRQKEAQKAKARLKASSDSLKSDGKINPITGFDTDTEIEMLTSAISRVSNLSKEESASFLKLAQNLKDQLMSGQPVSIAQITSFKDATADIFKKLDSMKGIEQLTNPFTMTERDKNRQIKQLSQALEEAVKIPSDNTQNMLKDTYALLNYLTHSSSQEDSATSTPDVDYQTLLKNTLISHYKVGCTKPNPGIIGI